MRLYEHFHEFDAVTESTRACVRAGGGGVGYVVIYQLIQNRMRQISDIIVAGWTYLIHNRCRLVGGTQAQQTTYADHNLQYFLIGLIRGVPVSISDCAHISLT